MSESQTPEIEQRCPSCHVQHTHLVNAMNSGRGPKPGDFGVCEGCEAVLRYVEAEGRYTLVKLDDAEVDPEYWPILAHLRICIRIRKVFGPNATILLVGMDPPPEPDPSDLN